MSNKKCLTYNAERTKEIYLNQVEMCCGKIITEGFTIEMLKKLCGAICYSSLFLMPEYELVNKKVYSFENICYYQRGLIKMAMHETLETLSDITIATHLVYNELGEILHSALLPEVLTDLGLSVKEVYAALLISYVSIKGDIQQMATTQQYIDEPRCTYSIMYSYFEREVYENGIRIPDDI